MLISLAYAQDGGGDGGGAFVQLLPLILIFVVFWLLLIRPQQKKMKLHRGMVSALRRGDRVVTAGGMIGSVSKVISDNELQVEIADGVKVRIVRSTVSEVLSKTEPAKGKDAKPGEAGSEPANDPGNAPAKSGGV